MADIMRLDASPRALARAEGAVYLIIIILGVFVELFVRGRIVVGGNAAATAANLRAMESLWRAGIAAEMVMVVCTIVSGLLLYLLLRPVSSHLALLATLFSLIGVTVEAGYAIHLVEALFPLHGNVQAFTQQQLALLTAFSMKAHGNGFGLALLLFVPAFLLRGFLVMKSGYFPRTVGVLYVITGLAYLANSFTLILAPHLAGRVFMIVAVPGFIGEATFCLWLLIRGLNVNAWNDAHATYRGAETLHDPST